MFHLCLGLPSCISQLLRTRREGALPSVGVRVSMENIIHQTVDWAVRRALDLNT